MHAAIHVEHPIATDGGKIKPVAAVKPALLVKPAAPVKHVAAVRTLN
jgi:hypothetical protein